MLHNLCSLPFKIYSVYHTRYLFDLNNTRDENIPYIYLEYFYSHEFFIKEKKLGQREQAKYYRISDSILANVSNSNEVVKNFVLNYKDNAHYAFFGSNTDTEVWVHYIIQDNKETLDLNNLLN